MVQHSQVPTFFSLTWPGCAAHQVPCARQLQRTQQGPPINLFVDHGLLSHAHDAQEHCAAFQCRTAFFLFLIWWQRPRYGHHPGLHEAPFCCTQGLALPVHCSSAGHDTDSHAAGFCIGAAYLTDPRASAFYLHSTSGLPSGVPTWGSFNKLIKMGIEAVTHCGCITSPASLDQTLAALLLSRLQSKQTSASR